MALASPVERDDAGEIARLRLAGAGGRSWLFPRPRGRFTLHPEYRV